MRLLAIIPARAGSKGVPGKNIKELNGLPLIAYTILSAIKAERIGKLVVSTDSSRISEIAGQFGAEVPFLRPAQLASDTASGIDVVLHAIEFFESKDVFYDDVMLLQPTSPFRSTADINQAIELYYSRECDSVISICESKVHPNLMRIIDPGGFLQDFTQIEDRHLRRQDMSGAYQLNGAIYITSVANMKRKKSFYGDKVVPYIMDIERSIDIDTELDFKIAEYIMKNRL